MPRSSESECLPYLEPAHSQSCFVSFSDGYFIYVVSHVAQSCLLDSSVISLQLLVCAQINAATLNSLQTFFIVSLIVRLFQGILKAMRHFRAHLILNTRMVTKNNTILKPEPGS